MACVEEGDQDLTQASWDECWKAVTDNMRATK
jgi:hypothetical protein